MLVNLPKGSSILTNEVRTTPYYLLIASEVLPLSLVMVLLQEHHQTTLNTEVQIHSRPLSQTTLFRIARTFLLTRNIWSAESQLKYVERDSKYARCCVFIYPYCARFFSKHSWAIKEQTGKYNTSPGRIPKNALAFSLF